MKIIGTFLYILLSVLIFGFLIFIHELGHYLTARKFGVTIKEFAIGMGPKIYSKISEKTKIVYSLRAFPIGGYVNMVGEDEVVENDPSAFSSKPVWQRMIITSAGAIMNILLGFLVMSIIVLSTKTLFSNTIASFADNAQSNTGDTEYNRLLVGDEIISIDGVRVRTAYETAYAISRYAVKPVDVTVKREGKIVRLSEITFSTVSESGVLFGVRDFNFQIAQKNFGTVIKNMYSRSLLSVKMIWHSLFDLITGKYGVEQISGPVGVTTAITDAAKSGIGNLAFILVLISINLGIFNLLPIPALDGGRLFFQLIELVFRRPVKRNIEAYIHFAGIVILILIMIAVTLKDIKNLF